jgi:hypothetical protein
MRHSTNNPLPNRHHLARFFIIISHFPFFLYEQIDEARTKEMQDKIKLTAVRPFDRLHGA